MIDKELVTRKVLLVTEDLRALGPLAAKPVAEYERSTSRACMKRCSPPCGTFPSI